MILKQHKSLRTPESVAVSPHVFTCAVSLSCWQSVVWTTDTGKCLMNAVVQRSPGFVLKAIVQRSKVYGDHSRKILEQGGGAKKKILPPPDNVSATLVADPFILNQAMYEVRTFGAAFP